MVMTMKKISLTLSRDGIQRGIDQIRAYKNSLDQQAGVVARELAAQGAEKARWEVENMDAVMDGELLDSIRDEMTGATSSAVVADAPHAPFVEYGTGIEAKESGIVHPELPQNWKHDSNEHGKAGWWYWNEKIGAFMHTTGMVPRPFMYNTKTWLLDNAVEIAKRALSE